MVQRCFTIELPNDLLEALGWGEGEVPARIKGNDGDVATAQG